jgi:hypothetical protein
MAEGKIEISNSDFKEYAPVSRELPIEASGRIVTVVSSCPSSVLETFRFVICWRVVSWQLLEIMALIWLALGVMWMSKLNRLGL